MINNPSVITSLTPISPTPPVWQPQPDWVSVSGVSSNEINLLVTQGAGIGFSVWLPTGTYSIDWGDGTVVSGCVSGTTYQHQHTIGGTLCSQGYNTWKVRIYGAGSQITRWLVTPHTFSTTAQHHPILWAVFGTTGMTRCDSMFTTPSQSVQTTDLQACNIASFANCTTTLSMFFGATCLQYVKMPSSWGSVTDATQMFYNCSPLSSIVLPTSWGSNALNLSTMFSLCISLVSVTLPASWGGVTNTTSMFSGCRALSSITLPTSWGNITNTTSMFYNCSLLYSIILPTSWGSVTTMTTMFYGCAALANINLGTSWSNSATNLTSMLDGCAGLTSVTLPASWGGVTNTTTMFNGCRALSSITLPTTWGSGAMTLSTMFQYCSALVSINLGTSWSGVTSTSTMFNGCTALSSVTLPASWGNITTVANMFNGCSVLKSITLPTSWGSVTNLTSMFQSCISLLSITLPTSWGSNALTLTSMFSNCYSLQSITLPTSWGGVITTSGMLNLCTALRVLILPAAFGAALVNISNMINGSTAITGVTNAAFLGSNVTQTNAQTIATNCEMLTTLTLGALLTRIGTNSQFSATPNKLTSLRLTNAGSTFTGSAPHVDVGYCSLAAADLDLLFGDLPILSGKTIRITGNPGVAGCTQTIATLKGWTVNSAT